MGALVRTKGTKRIVAHLNKEFDDYIVAFYRTPNIRDQFNPAVPTYKGLRNLTVNLMDPGDPDHSDRPDSLVLLPKTHPKHKRLEKRWKWFLNTANAADGSLTAANDAAIAAGIFKALTPKADGSFPYDSICFDAVEISSQQKVTVTDQHDGASLYMMIVLNTPPMPKVAGGEPIDP